MVALSTNLRRMRAHDYRDRLNLDESRLPQALVGQESLLAVGQLL